MSGRNKECRSEPAARSPRKSTQIRRKEKGRAGVDQCLVAKQMNLQEMHEMASGGEDEAGSFKSLAEAEDEEIQEDSTGTGTADAIVPICPSELIAFEPVQLMKAQPSKLRYPHIRLGGPTGHDIVLGSDDEDSQEEAGETVEPYLPAVLMRSWIDEQMATFPDGDVAKRVALFAAFSEPFGIMQANGTEITEEDKERMGNRFSEYHADMCDLYDAAH